MKGTSGKKILIKKGQMLADGPTVSRVNCYKPALLVYKGNGLQCVNAAEQAVFKAKHTQL